MSARIVNNTKRAYTEHEKLWLRNASREPNVGARRAPATTLHARCVRGLPLGKEPHRYGDAQAVTFSSGPPTHPVVATMNHDYDSTKVRVRVLLHQSAFGPEGWGRVPTYEEEIRYCWLTMSADEFLVLPWADYVRDGNNIRVYSDDKGIEQ